MRTYVCQICRGRFPAAPLGRLPRACPEHREERNRRKDRERHKAVYNGLTEQLMPCCEDHRASGKKGRFCPQHRQFRRFLADNRRTPSKRPGKPAYGGPGRDAGAFNPDASFNRDDGEFTADLKFNPDGTFGLEAEVSNRGYSIRRSDPSPDLLPPDYHPYFVPSKDSRI